MPVGPGRGRPLSGHRVTPQSRGLIDTTKFEPVVQDALEAFRTDPSYAIAIADAARNILMKRTIWKARRQVRQAEDAARTQCEANGPQICPVTTGHPCGVPSDCPFGAPELAALPIRVSGSTRVAPRVRPGADGKHATYLPDAVTWSLAFPEQG